MHKPETGAPGGADGSATARAAAGDSQWILERERVNGGPFWSRADGNIHAPAGFSTLLVLNVLGELGATRLTHPLIADAADTTSSTTCTVLAHYPQARADTRFAEAVRRLSEHVNAAGEMVIDTPPRAWAGRPLARKDTPSELATRRWQQIQALLSKDQGPGD